MLSLSIVKVLVLLLFAIQFVDGSFGDLQDSYQQCTKLCKQAHDCPQRFDRCAWGAQPCFDCKYACMWQTTTDVKNRHAFVPQFHGKWPFIALRIAGLVIQEPASVLFSLLNLFTTYLFWLRLSVYSNIEEKSVWRRYCMVGMVTWVSSSLFHCVDCWVTEWLDYFSACAFIFAGLSVSAIITLPELANGRHGRTYRTLVPLLSFFIWLNHIWGLMYHFDYAFNMQVCMIAAGMSTILYGRFLLNRYLARKRLTHGDWMLIWAILLLKGSMAFELLDFPPIWWILDAHALFHLATIPVPLMLHYALRSYAQEEYESKTV